MASIFTYQNELPRIHSPWSTPGNSTPLASHGGSTDLQSSDEVKHITRLEPERQEGPCEYKLHLLLRARRKFVSTTTDSGVERDVHDPVNNGSVPSTRSMSETLLYRPSYLPSPHTRQARLQQLTTQLLWRLQQSSPFHSSSNTELVLPVLPEATPRLGVPDRPAKLIPGLEESQGALYEIGVADDGALIGLVDDELEESLNNLRAMAASLGCVVEILRKVSVGRCEWTGLEGQGIIAEILTGELSVAEVLVRPDARTVPSAVPSTTGDTEQTHKYGMADVSEHNRHGTEAMRIAVVGPSGSGKSSLIGTLASSMLDNGRGKSRLSLLKHRHEIASGMTSAVAHELVGYKTEAGYIQESVVNYASGDVSSWTDIHNLADRLCLLIDSPGLAKFSKSMFRSLISWQPRWTISCTSADDEQTLNEQNNCPPEGLTEPTTRGQALMHLELCLKLNVPLVVVITKMDCATKQGLRHVLSNILTKVKMYGRTPLILSSASQPLPSFSLDSNKALPDLQGISVVEEVEIQKTLIALEADNMSVPIVMTSAVSGTGIGKVHAILRRLPIPSLDPEPTTVQNNELCFHIDEVFSIPPSRVYSSQAEARQEPPGVVLCGYMQDGTASVGDAVCIGPFPVDDHIDSPPLKRSKSFTLQDVRRSSQPASSGSMPKSLRGESRQSSVKTGSSGPSFVAVRVVSIRNLRLPMLSIGCGQTGTIGVELIGNYADALPFLQKARKGMILRSRLADARASRSFTATFSHSDFASTASPPLLLGGLAIAYVKSIRAAVKVTALELIEHDGLAPPSPTELFTFDGDSELRSSSEEACIRITFRFISTVEVLHIDDKVLVVPTVCASGPVTGPSVSASPLAGFVGNVDGVHE